MHSKMHHPLLCIVKGKKGGGKEGMKGKNYQVFKEFQKGSFLGVFTEKELKVLMDLRNQMMIKNDIERRLRAYRRISIGSMAKRLRMRRNVIWYILKKL